MHKITVSLDPVPARASELIEVYTDDVPPAKGQIFVHEVGLKIPGQVTRVEEVTEVPEGQDVIWGSKLP